MDAIIASIVLAGITLVLFAVMLVTPRKPQKGRGKAELAASAPDRAAAEEWRERLKLAGIRARVALVSDPEGGRGRNGAYGVWVSASDLEHARRVLDVSGRRP